MKQLLVLVLVIFLAPVLLAGEELTYKDLVDRMIDLERLALLPEPDEHCGLISCYDPTSKYDEETGQYVDWDANEDNCEGMRKSTDQLGILLGEMEGPGCIWRIWSATAQKGHVKIYLDGAAEPAVDLPFEDYFTCTQPPFTRPALVNTVTNGENCYIPIPFQKSCKIVADKDYGQYYHFTYSLFPEGTVVPTFSRHLTPQENAALDQANAFLEHCGPDSFKANPNQKTQPFDIQLGPGQTKTIFLEGKRAILSLQVRPQLPTDVEGQRKALRELALQVFWDDAQTPDVWCPLGDFFGTGPGVNLYRSLPLGMTEEGFYSNWYMPFETGAKLELLNEGDTTRQLTLEITHAPHTLAVGSYGRFHAKWHRDAFLPKEKGRQGRVIVRHRL